MSRWFRRLSYLFAVILWLMLMSFPVFAFLLATNGQIQMGSDPQSHLRIFLLLDEQESGIGMEWTRRISQNANCSLTSVRYFLWESSEKQPVVRFCQCLSTDGAFLIPAACPEE